MREALKIKLKKLMRKTLKSDPKHLHYFHAYKESDKIRSKIIDIISEEKCDIYCVVINKKNKDLYMKALDSMLELLDADKNIKEIKIASYDKRKNTINKYKRNSRFDIKFSTPQHETLLQIADLVSWSIYQSFENSNDKWLETLKQNSKFLVKQNP